MSRILENVEQHKINLEGEREEITDTLLKEREDQKWVSWVKEFGDRIDELNSPEFDVFQKKKFLEGIVEKILVTNTDIQTHELVIHFKFPYVGDKIIWKNEQKKSDGYKIRRGRNSTKVVYDLLKK